MAVVQQKITPNLWFDHQALEAAEFYTSIFGNSAVNLITHYGPTAAAASGQPEGSVLTVEFTLEDQTFIAINGGPAFQFTPAISFMILCDTQDEIDRLWDRLSAGGQTMQCGWLQDKYGVPWQVVPTILDPLAQDPDPNKSEAVMAAMLKMNKLIIKDLQDAYDNA